MWSRITSFLKLPNREEEDTQRIAGFLKLFLVLALGFVGLRMITALPALPSSLPVFIIALLVWLACLGLFWLTRRGHVWQTAFLTAAILTLAVNVGATLSGGVDRPLFATNLTALIFVALTFGPGATVGFAAVDILAGLGLIWARLNGLLPVPPAGSDFIVGASSQLINLAASATYLSLVARNLQTALGRARSSEAQYRTLFEEAPYGICIADAGNRITLANPAARQLLGYGADEMLGKAPSDFIAPDDLARRPARSAAELRQAGALQRERLLIRKDGSPVPVTISSKAMADGRFQYILQDISALKLADETLRRSEQLHRQAIEASGLVPYYQTYTGPDRTQPVFTFIGEGIYQMTGYKPGEFTSPLFDTLIQEAHLVGEAAQYSFDDAIHRARAGQLRIWKCDYRIRTRDGQTRWLFDAALELLDEHWTTLGSIGTFQDVTERKQAVEEVQRLNAELEGHVAERTAELAEANKELESFAYSVSHDLRAPLRSVDGFAHLLLDDYGGQLPGEAREHLARIIKSTKRMGMLIDDLLAFSRLGRRPLNRQATSTAGLVSEVLRELSPAPPVEVAVGELPDCEADPSLLRQVFENLLSNAFKYSSKRPVARVEVGWADGGYFVRDNGAGFDMQYAGKLFGVFQRLHTWEEFEGTGIGLAIVQRIISRHGGRVWAEAEPDKGATFHFTLGLD
jgi:PAS domain S-box-containing protein